MNTYSLHEYIVPFIILLILDIINLKNYTIVYNCIQMQNKTNLQQLSMRKILNIIKWKKLTKELALVFKNNKMEMNLKY
jgi:hypothetical protein